jgi:hypothetical protein
MCFRVAGNSALGAAEGNIHHCALPRHPGGQRLHLIQRYLRVVADAALGGTAHLAVLHAIAFKAVNVPVVHAHRHRDHQDPFGILDHLPNIVVEAHGVCCRIEVLQGNVVCVPCTFVISIFFPPCLKPCRCPDSAMAPIQATLASASRTCSGCCPR